MKAYKKQQSDGESVDVINTKKRGRPTDVSKDVEDRVMREICVQSQAGSHVSTKSAIALTIVTMEILYPHQAKSLKLKKSWGQSLFR